MLRFRHERLAHAREREQQRAHWQKVIASIADALQARHTAMSRSSISYRAVRARESREGEVARRR